jgi:hypothetical protein
MICCGKKRKRREKVSMDDNFSLTRKFLQEEIKEGVFQMEKTKTVGLDGIPA